MPCFFRQLRRVNNHFDLKKKVFFQLSYCEWEKILKHKKYSNSYIFGEKKDVENRTRTIDTDNLMVNLYMFLLLCEVEGQTPHPMRFVLSKYTNHFLVSR